MKKMWYLKWFTVKDRKIMANQLVTSIESLKSALGSQDTRKASNLLDTITQYYENSISDAETGKFFLFVYFKE